MRGRFDTHRAHKIYREFLKRHLKHYGKTKKDFNQIRNEFQPPAQIIDARKDLLTPSIDIRIDLRFSEKKILEQVAQYVKKFKDYYEDFFEETIREFENGISEEHTELVLKQMSDRRLEPHYKKRVRDKSLDQYELQLRVWDLHVEDNKTFAEISRQLNGIKSPDMARDFFKAAEKNIREGPGPAFGRPFR